MYNNIDAKVRERIELLQTYITLKRNFSTNISDEETKNKTLETTYQYLYFNQLEKCVSIFVEKLILVTAHHIVKYCNICQTLNNQNDHLYSSQIVIIIENMSL